MTKGKSDPLLTTARYVVAGLMGLMAFTAAAVTIGLGAVLTAQRQHLMDKLAAANIPPSGYGAILLLMVCALALIVLIFLFLRQLSHIIGSVREGDPFIPANADRLRSMGWMALATQPLLWTMMAIGAWLHQFDKVPVAQQDFSFSGGGLLLGLVLFILARVFRIGTEMREELEGTI